MNITIKSQIKSHYVTQVPKRMLTQLDREKVFLACAETLSPLISFTTPDPIGRLTDLDERQQTILSVSMNQALSMLPPNLARTTYIQAGYLLCLHIPLLAIAASGSFHGRKNCNHDVVFSQLGLAESEVWQIAVALAMVLPQHYRDIETRLQKLATQFGTIPGTYEGS